MSVIKGKIVVIGAGFVGASAASAIAMRGITSELVLIDVNKEKAFGEALDLNHGLAIMGQMSIRDGGYEEVAGADIIVLTAGANRKPGETRLDLARKNVGIVRTIIPEIMKHYNGAIILVVSNPVDVITYLVQKETGIPAQKVISSGTFLDSSRLGFELSQLCDVDVSNVNALFIGEHGDSAVPLWSTASVGGERLDDYLAMNDIELDKAEMYTKVQQAGATVIKNKGATYYAIGLCVTRICEAILKNQNSILPVGSLINGTFGIEGVVLSIPSIVNKKGIEKVLEINLTEKELELLKASAAKLKETLSEVI
ncbi:MAG: L-lactate dehydrogenase [Bacillota bacterium]